MSSPVAEGEICVINIGPRERRKRMIFGIVAFAVSLAILAALVATGLSRWWRLALFLPFAASGAGYFQARDKT